MRDVINKYGENAKIHLGGIPMIADDMMSFIKSDIVVFGIGVFIFIILTEHHQTTCFSIYHVSLSHFHYHSRSKDAKTRCA